MEMDASFGYWLRRRRKVLDLTQDALAERVGCSTGTIRKIEADERRPSRQLAEILATVLEIDPKDRPTFLQVARGERRTERLGAVAPPPVVGSPPAAHPSPLAPRLRIPPTPFIGRQAELVELNALLQLPECRLLTVVGPGGIGKTRLVLAAAQTILDFGFRISDWNDHANPKSKIQNLKFADGVHFVPLAPLAAAEFIIPAIANALGFTFSGSTEPTTQLLTYLRRKDLLIVLDNFEHLLDGASLITAILEQTTGAKLLVTSRERLNLLGEWVFELQGLPTPPAQPSPAWEASQDYSSVALFVEHAQRLHTGFALMEQTYEHIARICRLVDGMPLAIELAAAWVHVLPCAEIAQEIEHNLDFLAITRRDVPERHRSLRAAFDHSWKLLSDEERGVMRRLSVLRGGCTREAAEQVAGATLPVLAALVTKSLLQRTASGRYDLHELVRQYAGAKLAEDALNEGTPSTLSKVCRAHATYFLNLALTAGPHLTGSQQVMWLDRLEQEHHNFRAALDWTLEAGEREVGLQLATALMWFWSQRDHKREGYAHLRKQLAQPVASPSLARVRALSAASYLAFEENDSLAAQTLLDEALQISNLFQEDKVALAETLHSAAGVAILQADYVTARAFLEQNLALAKELGNQNDIDGAFIGLGDIALLQGDLAQAQTIYTDGIRSLRKLQNSNLLAYALRQCSKVRLRLGDVQQAGLLCRESLMLNQETQSQQGVIACLAGLAAVIAARGQARQATQLFGAVEALLARLATPLLPIDRIEHERTMATLRAQLSPAVWTTAWAEGHAMSMEQAISVALALNESLTWPAQLGALRAGPSTG